MCKNINLKEKRTTIMIASHTKEDINILCLSGNAYTIASAELVEKQYNTLYVKYKY